MLGAILKSCALRTRQIGLRPEMMLERIDVGDDYFSRRPYSAAAKKALAVFKISFARLSSATSLRNGGLLWVTWGTW